MASGSACKKRHYTEKKKKKGGDNTQSVGDQGELEGQYTQPATIETCQNAPRGRFDLVVGVYLETKRQGKARQSRHDGVMQDAKQNKKVHEPHVKFPYSGLSQPPTKYQQHQRAFRGIDTKKTSSLTATKKKEKQNIKYPGFTVCTSTS